MLPTCAPARANTAAPASSAGCRSPVEPYFVARNGTRAPALDDRAGAVLRRDRGVSGGARPVRPGGARRRGLVRNRAARRGGPADRAAALGDLRARRVGIVARAAVVRARGAGICDLRRDLASDLAGVARALTRGRDRLRLPALRR